MTKLTKDDLALWNSYKSNLKRVAKKVNNVEKIKIPLNKENKTTKIIDFMDRKTRFMDCISN